MADIDIFIVGGTILKRKIDWTTCLLHDKKFEDTEWIYSFVIGTIGIGGWRFR